MEIMNVNINDLIPYENNPRNNKNAIEAVSNSIKEFGFRNPIIIDKNNVIICGHTRYLAAIQLNLSKIPCIIADDLSNEKVKAFRLIDNKTAELAKWDFDLLSEEIKELTDIDISEFGFDKWEIDNLLSPVDENYLNDFFIEESRKKKKEKTEIQCPHCGEWFEQ